MIVRFPLGVTGESMTSHIKPQANVDNLPLAVAAIVFTVLALSLGDALIKFTSGNFALWQIFVLRSCLVLPVLVIYLAVWKPQHLSIPPAFGWTVLRSLLLVGMWVSYYLALPHLDLSAAAATYYTIPIFLTLFSALLIGEKVGRLGWLSVVLGFVGVLVILRPNAGDFNIFALLPLLAAILYALAMILTRSKCREVHPIMLSVSLNVSFIVVGGAATLALMGQPSDRGDSFFWPPGRRWARLSGSPWR